MQKVFNGFALPLLKNKHIYLFFTQKSGRGQEVVVASPVAQCTPRMKTGAATKAVSDMYRAEILKVRARI